MLKIRLRRMGKRHSPFYRVVVSDSRRTPTASAVDEVGHYDPQPTPPRLALNLDRLRYWQQQGAQLSPTVSRLMQRAESGTLEAPVAEEVAAKPARAKKAAKKAGKKAGEKAGEKVAAQAAEAPAPAEVPQAAADEVPPAAEETPQAAAEEAPPAPEETPKAAVEEAPQAAAEPPQAAPEAEEPATEPAAADEGDEKPAEA